MPISLAFIVCVEPGPTMLEYKSACLFMTMRRNTGVFSSCPIYAYSPRQGKPASKWLQDLMARLNIVYITIPLNEKFDHYPLANKPICFAHAQANLSEEIIVFLDSDILFWKQPDCFLLEKGIDIALVPDTTKTFASAGPGDPYEEYWLKLYELVGTAHRPYVTTTLTAEKVRGTWNSGVIVVRRLSNIAVQWRDTLFRLMENDFSPPACSYLRENITLSAVATAHYDALTELPVSYNYPIQNWNIMADKGTSPEQAILWHYQPFLNKAFGKFSVRLDKAASLGNKVAAVNTFIEDLRFHYHKRIGLDESLLASLRRHIRIGPRLCQLKQILGKGFIKNGR